MPPKTYYDSLGLDRAEATKAEIMSQTWHKVRELEVLERRVGESEDADAKEALRAYMVLGDKLRKTIYDRLVTIENLDPVHAAAWAERPRWLLEIMVHARSCSVGLSVVMIMTHLALCQLYLLHERLAGSERPWTEVMSPVWICNVMLGCLVLWLGLGPVVKQDPWTALWAILSVVMTILKTLLLKECLEGRGDWFTMFATGAASHVFMELAIHTATYSAEMDRWKAATELCGDGRTQNTQWIMNQVGEATSRSWLGRLWQGTTISSVLLYVSSTGALDFCLETYKLHGGLVEWSWLWLVIPKTIQTVARCVLLRTEATVTPAMLVPMIVGHFLWLLLYSYGLAVADQSFTWIRPLMWPLYCLCLSAGFQLALLVFMHFGLSCDGDDQNAGRAASVGRPAGAGGGH